MAVDYQTLRGAFEDSIFRNRVEVAMADAAYLVLNEADGTTNHANRVKLAFAVLENSDVFTRRMLKALLPKNKAAGSLATITGATDNALLAQVQSLWDEFADHYAA